MRDCTTGESSPHVVSSAHELGWQCEGDLAMKIRHILIASAALAAGPAFSQDAITLQASADCVSLQSQFDQAAATASIEQLKASKAARMDGGQLCLEGKREEGADKLREAMSALLQLPHSQQPMEHPASEQAPPLDTQRLRAHEPPL
jgi:hypothetical protein